MIDILGTIAPIFVIICLGWMARQMGFVPTEFLAPANRLVFYIAIPAIIFRSVSKASLHQEFDIAVLAVSLGSILAVFLLAWAGAYLVGIGKDGNASGRGTFVQAACHGNLGYIGLAVAYYALGQAGLTKASIYAGFIMILQNVLAVFILQFFSGRPDIRGNRGVMFKRIVGNPVIFSSIAGMIVSFFGIPIPKVIDQSLQILAGMSLPLALLIIGASLNFELVRHKLVSTLGSGAFKLMVMPAIGFAGFHVLRKAPQQYLPALVLLAAPTATLAYVMAREIDGDTELAVAAISVNTLLSAAAFIFWLQVAG